MSTLLDCSARSRPPEPLVVCERRWPPSASAFVWFGVRKSLSPQQKEEAADSFGAEGSYLSAAKKLLDVKHPAFKFVTTVRGPGAESLERDELAVSRTGHPPDPPRRRAGVRRADDVAPERNWPKRSLQLERALRRTEGGGSLEARTALQLDRLSRLADRAVQARARLSERRSAGVSAGTESGTVPARASPRHGALRGSGADWPKKRSRPSSPRSSSHLTERLERHRRRQAEGLS